ncbi:unnamed protein product [Aspergillus oryzae RIB40]|uniref:DNA, SC009 n=1 Tax=Aspergillus oryzae (strain ATCC 42149 / RIB 40) TaxID=510516 RepID=Q2UTZ8_ASPOR|nr:unnamed protein product [Aspergillus oryzae RIB40]KOC12425.1 hypothetical protein AFLA70_40g004171 [Aspergillus flavus AF70]BAE54967.1 unnamed protein product [Aspergillus oryzae RIB40]
MDHPKRVILRLQEADLDEADLYEPVRLYLEKNGRSIEELDTDRHFVHIQPPNPDIPQVDPKLHVVIDLEAEKYTGKLGPDFPYEGSSWESCFCFSIIGSYRAVDFPLNSEKPFQWGELNALVSLLLSRDMCT